MAVYPTSVKIYTYLGSSWTDLTSDVIGAISVRRGISGVTPVDRIASTGVLKFTLKNTTHHYTPFLSGSLSGWTYGVLVKLVVTYSGTSYIKFYGVVDNITLVSNPTGYFVANVTCVDWINYAASTILTRTALFSGTAEECLNELMGELSGPMAGITLDADSGGVTYPVFFSEVKEKTTVYSEIARLVESSLGYFYQANDPTLGWKLVYEGPTHRTSLDTVEATLDNTMLDVVVKFGETLVNRVNILTYKITYDTGSSIVLYEATSTVASSPVVITAGSTGTIKINFKDPNERGDVVGSAMDAHSTGTDSVFHYVGGGSAFGYFTASAVYGVADATYTFTNTGASTIYLVYLRAKGLGVYRSSAVTSSVSNAASIASYGYREISLDQKYAPDSSGALSAGGTWLSLYRSPHNLVTQVMYSANTSDALYQMFMQMDIGSLIRVVEGNMHLDVKGYIHQETFDLFPGGFAKVQYDLLTGGSLTLTKMGLEFMDEVHTYVDFGDLASLQNLTTRSLAIRFKLASNDVGNLWSQQQTTGYIRGTSLAYTGSGNLIWYVGGDDDAYDFSGFREPVSTPPDGYILNLNTLYDVVITWDSSVKTNAPHFWVNGVDYGGEAYSPYIMAGNILSEAGAPFRIGGEINGQVNFVKYYNVILTGTEISNLHSDVAVTRGLMFEGCDVPDNEVDTWNGVSVDSGDLDLLEETRMLRGVIGPNPIRLRKL